MTAICRSPLRPRSRTSASACRGRRCSRSPSARRRRCGGRNRPARRAPSPGRRRWRRPAHRPGSRARSGSSRASKSSTGGGSFPGLPLRLFRNDCCNDENRNRASASVSAAVTLTPSMTYGAASCADGRNRCAVDRHRLHHHRRREMRGERERQPEDRRKLRAIGAGAQDPDRHLEPGAGNRLHRLARLRPAGNSPSARRRPAGTRRRRRAGSAASPAR